MQDTEARDLLRRQIVIDEENVAKARELVRLLRRQREDTLRARVVFGVLADVLREHRRLLAEVERPAQPPPEPTGAGTPTESVSRASRGRPRR
jgi:hypothetical protein